MVCPHCFQSNDAGAAFCRECGAPLKDAEGSDQEVYQDLARANLFRMRGDSKAATDVCLGILKRFPHNPTAHSLLGDISADSGDLAQAATWYEMALDLVPDSTVDKQKLDSVRQRVSLMESAETAKQIGIPEKGPAIGPYIALVVVTVLAVGTGAFFIGKSLRPTKADDTITGQVTVGSPRPEDPPESRPTDVPAVKDEQKKPEPERHDPGVGPDAAWLATLQAKATDKTTFLGLVSDPRTQSASVTVRAVTGESFAVTATRAALDVFRSLPAFTKLTVRVLQDNTIVLVADMSGEAAKTAEAALAAGDTIESQAQVMLSDVWSPHASTGGDQGQPPGGTTGGG